VKRRFVSATMVTRFCNASAASALSIFQWLCTLVTPETHISCLFTLQRLFSGLI
jgi:hypothetical protein